MGSSQNVLPRFTRVDFIEASLRSKDGEGGRLLGSEDGRAAFWGIVGAEGVAADWLGLEKFIALIHHTICSKSGREHLAV